MTKHSRHNRRACSLPSATSPTPQTVPPSQEGKEDGQTGGNVLLLPLILLGLALIAVVFLALCCFTVRRRRQQKLTSDGIAYLNPTFDNNLYGESPLSQQETDRPRVDSTPPLYPSPPPPYPGMERPSSAYLEPVSVLGAAASQPGETTEYGTYETLDGYTLPEKKRSADSSVDYDRLTPCNASRKLSTEKCCEKTDTAIGVQPGGTVEAMVDDVYEAPPDGARAGSPATNQLVGVSESAMCAQNDVNESIYEELDKVTD